MKAQTGIFERANTFGDASKEHKSWEIAWREYTMKISPFSFCKHCKVSQKCCTTLKLNGVVAPVLLTRRDRDQIEDYLGEDACHFSWVEFDGDSGRDLTFTMTRPEGGCIFHNNNRCEIYDVRPLDCRIFPLDILKVDNHFYWIIYSTFCQQMLNYEMLQGYADKIVRGYEEHMEEFAVRMKMSPPLAPFKILRKINI